jgi:hypothetical protein
MRTALVVLLITAAAACGGGGDDTGDDDPGDDDPGDDDAGELGGRIEIEEAELGTIGMSSSIYASFVAPDEPDLVDDGTCRVYPYPCLGSVGACESPEPHSAGTITLTGLTQAITLTPDPETHGYAAPGGLPDDLFADAASIMATADGDEVGGFSLGVTGVTPMDSGYVDAPLGLVPGEPFELTWKGAADAASVELRVNWADLCHAGAEWYVLVCEVPDTGAFTVPAAITEALPSPGFGHCGARLARIRRAESTSPAGVELVVRSSDFFGFL